MAPENSSTSPETPSAEGDGWPEPSKPKKRAGRRMIRSICLGAVFGGVSGVLFLVILAILVLVRMSLDSGQDTGQNVLLSLWGLTCFGPFLILFCTLLGAVAGLVRSRM